ncbi:MAG: hypothetical protein D6830_03760 [Ignavibacteria bacterium]|nr:MAG: hypothetical protein D6830_03760 [Ignavibacteria bacterium]
MRGRKFFACLLCRAERGIQQRGKARKNYSFLIEKNYFARALKRKIEIFAGFACPAPAGLSRWVG